MAKFEPGHLHIERHALTKQDYSYNLTVDYEVTQNPTEGQGIQFHLHGTVGDESRSAPVDETFFMAKDQAYNFAHEISTLLKKKFGAIQGNEITSLHDVYDKMFEDIRSKLGVKSGDPIKPEHLG